MNAKPQIVKFNNQQLPVFFYNQMPYVAMKPICENIGLQWEAQLRRIKRNHILSKGMSIMDIPSKGGIQQYVCLPLGLLNGWLMGVDISKVKLEIKDTLIKYQLECYDVLYKHFMPKPQKQIDMALYVSKELHNKIALKYHRMFRQYDDLVDRLRDQVDEMQRKCRRYDMKLHNDSIPLDLAAIRLGVTQTKIKQLFIDERMIEERTPYIETDKKVLNLTKRGLKLEFLFMRSEIIEGEVQDIIMITEDGIQYLQGMLNK